MQYVRHTPGGNTSITEPRQTESDNVIHYSLCSLSKLLVRMGEKQYCLWENWVFENFFNFRMSQIPRFTWRNESKKFWIILIFIFLFTLVQYKLDVRDFRTKTDFWLWWTYSLETKQKNLTGSWKALELSVLELNSMPK